MITIAVVNQKGGVGKTTIAFNLSQILSKKAKVLAIDNDPQGNLTLSFFENPSELKSNILDAYDDKSLEPVKISKTLFVIGSNIKLSPVAERDFQVIFKLKEKLKQFKQFDYTIIDCLPSFGNLHLASLVAADYVLIPVKPAPYSLSGLKDLFLTIERAKKYFNSNLKILGIVINQADGRKIILEKEMEALLRKNYGSLVFKSKVKKRVKIEESPMFQKSITSYNPHSKAAQEFHAVTREVLRRIKNGRTQ